MKFFDRNAQQYGQPTRDDLLQSLKPIETRYNGYRFRSRTEARWAVLLDTLGVKYEYEKEGFELICGSYLPDFWLPYPGHWNFSGYPGAGHWVEIKGTEPTQEELSRLLHLSLETKHSGHLFWGTPWNFKRYFVNRHGQYGWVCDIDEHCSSPEIGLLYRALIRFMDITSRATFDIAVSRSKSARFEFGENG